MDDQQEKARHELRGAIESVLSTFGQECCENGNFTMGDVRAYAEDICDSAERIYKNNSIQHP